MKSSLALGWAVRQEKDEACAQAGIEKITPRLR
jgi:hypothetical protein